MSNKYDAPPGPPPSYGSEPQAPQPAYQEPYYNNNEAPGAQQGFSDPRGMPQQGYYGSPAPGQYQASPYPPQQQGYPPPQQGYPPPQQGYYQQQQPMYVQQPYGQQQQQQQSGSSGGGMCAGIMGALACCCCLDILF